MSIQEPVGKLLLQILPLANCGMMSYGYQISAVFSREKLHGYNGIETVFVNYKKGTTTN